MSPVLGYSFMAATAFEVILAGNQVELAREYYKKQQKAAEDAETATQELEIALKKIQQEATTLVNTTSRHHCPGPFLSES